MNLCYQLCYGSHGNIPQALRKLSQRGQVEMNGDPIHCHQLYDRFMLHWLATMVIIWFEHLSPTSKSSLAEQSFCENPQNILRATCTFKGNCNLY